MGMDGLSLYAMRCELTRLVDGRVDKVAQPERDKLLLSIRAGGENYKLFFCTAADSCRVQLTELSFKNPAEPPMFCMLLRKRLVGGRILEVEQPLLDRVLVLTIQARNELGDSVPYKLVAEIMGKYSNLILVDENGVIIDSIRHVGLDMSSVRLVVPGLKYEAPPPQDKRDPREAQEGDFFAALSGGGRADKALAGAFSGLAPAIAARLIACAVGDVPLDTLTETQQRLISSYLFKFYQRVSAGEFSPALLVNEYKEPVAAFPFVPYAPEANLIRVPSMSAALDEFYARREIAERIKRRSASILKVLQNNAERCAKKLSLYQEALDCDELMEQSRLFGELLIANAQSVKRGSKEAMVLNYYLDPPQYVAVPLDERYSAADNAQRYYKKYQKLRGAKALALKQRDEARAELEYIEGQLDNLDKCTDESELAELREELISLGYVRRDAKATKQRQERSKPMRFMSSDGIDIYVGKNNTQNDELTLKFASGEDIWLHTKDIPGSHVIIKSGGSVPDATLLQAAQLAAYYSRGRSGSQVPVDYTPRKYVKKPSGARPGKVIYTTNRTIYVTPDENAVRNIKLMQ